MSKIKMGIVFVTILLTLIFALAGCGKKDLAEDEKNMIGKWESQKETEDADEDSLYLDFKEDFTVSVTLNNLEPEVCTWAMKDGSCVIQSEKAEISIVATINEDGSLYVQYTDGEDLYAMNCVKKN